MGDVWYTYGCEQAGCQRVFLDAKLPNPHVVLCPLCDSPMDYRGRREKLMATGTRGGGELNMVELAVNDWLESTARRWEEALRTRSFGDIPVLPGPVSYEAFFHEVRQRKVTR